LAPEAEVRSGARLIRIVEMLAMERRPLTAGEIAERLAIPLSSAHRLLATLVNLRWAERKSARLYRIGPRLLGVGGLALGRSALVQAARPVLGGVAEISGLDSYLGVLVGDSVTYLARATGRGPDTPEFKLGALQPLHCTSAGKLLLAFLPQDEREALLKMLTLRQFTDRTILERDVLVAALDGIRENHYSIDTGEFNEFWRSVAVPVQGSDGDVVAAITCGGRPDRMTVEHQGWMRQEMSVLAEELSGQLA
jgi:IclR family transcriptional regulator, pca regulon regulatory protein